jgi:protein SCO1/2
MVRFVLFCVLAVLMLVSCKRSPGTDSGSSPISAKSTNERVFQVKGIIKALRPRQKEIEIKHESIPGYMPAMTMPFDVKDINELAGLEPEQPSLFVSR